MPEVSPELARDIARAIEQALAEDIGSGDLTAALVPEQGHSRARILARDNAILCGIPWVGEVFGRLDTRIDTEWAFADGDAIEPGDVVCTITGPSRPLLSGERTALNLLQMLSATATSTQAYVSAIAGTGARILDTRKTIPGLRLAQKYAVRCGGGNNHRVGLYDAVLIKENHIAAAGGIRPAVEAAIGHAGSVMIEVEVESLAQLEEALTTNAQRILLDNFDVPGLRRAVALRDTAGEGAIELEASGGITLANVRNVAATGVDFISVGAITKDVLAVDFSMRFD